MLQRAGPVGYFLRVLKGVLFLGVLLLDPPSLIFILSIDGRQYDRHLLVLELVTGCEARCLRVF
jgi:hypothetical protein